MNEFILLDLNDPVPAINLIGQGGSLLDSWASDKEQHSDSRAAAVQRLKEKWNASELSAEMVAPFAPPPDMSRGQQIDGWNAGDQDGTTVLSTNC